MEYEGPNNNNNRRVVVKVPASSPHRQQQQQQHAAAALSPSAEAARSSPSPPPQNSVTSSSGSPVVSSGRSILRKMAVAAAANDDGNATTRGSSATTNLLSTVVTVKKAAKRFAAAAATKKQQRRRESNSLSDTAQSSSPSQGLFTAMRTISVVTNSNADTTGKKTTTTTGAQQQEVSDNDPAGLRSSESFGALNPLASSSSFHQSTRVRRATREGSGAFGALEKEDTFLGSASSGGTGITLRKIFNDADLAGVGFLTPAQAFAAMKVVGVVLKKKEFYEILDEIDVNAGNNEHNSAEESDWLRKEKRRRHSSSSGNKRRGTFDDDDGSTTESSEDNNFSSVAQPQQKSSRRRVVILEEGAPHDDGELSLSLEDDEVVITQVTNNAGNQRQHQQHDNPLSADSLSISSGLDRSSDEDATTTTTTTTTASPTIIVNNQNALSATKASILEKVASRLQRRRRRNRRVLFEDFEKLIELWQSAARFQLFEKRSDETEARLQATMDNKFLATDSAAMWVWQLIMLFVGCYLVMVPVAVFTNTVPEVAQYFALYTPSDAIVTVLLVADMILKCCTCVTTRVNGVSVVVDDLRGIMREYVRSPWFWIDLLVLVPWRFTILAGGDTDYIMRYDNSTGLLIHPELSGCHGCKTLDDYNFAVDIATVLLLIRGLKFLEHYRYFEETGLTPLTRNFVQRQYVVGMGIIQGARFVVLVHTLAVIYLSKKKSISKRLASRR
ncbi:ion transporter, putative [Bodo saltans]|uniref:Ion transporter, putative n=1 Tax=Bodo saltans TaxID=75058 RepID=A0A0S4J5S2_BODSA|nr:ion transporter, putative [Bodo saltans]|eukprot:CUG60117.1 ion transporter, putative [Bodo saltans]